MLICQEKRRQVRPPREVRYKEAKGWYRQNNNNKQMVYNENKNKLFD